MAERAPTRVAVLTVALAAASAGCGEDQGPGQPSRPGEVRLDTDSNDRGVERSVDRLRERADEFEQNAQARREREAARLERRRRARVQPSVPENEILLDEAREGVTGGD